MFIKKSKHYLHTGVNSSVTGVLEAELASSIVLKANRDELPPEERQADRSSENRSAFEGKVSKDNFDAVVARYYKSVYNIIYQWLGDSEEASDFTQETFVSAYKAIDQFRGDSRIYTWLYRIAHNHCKNRFKIRDRQRGFEGPSLDAGTGSDSNNGDSAVPPLELADWTFSPADILEKKELRALIESAVSGLASEYKVVLTLREIEGLSYNEIATVTGLTMEAVKTRLNRARAMVRQKVEPYIRP